MKHNYSQVQWGDPEPTFVMFNKVGRAKIRKSPKKVKILVEAARGNGSFFARKINAGMCERRIGMFSDFFSKPLPVPTYGRTHTRSHMGGAPCSLGYDNLNRMDCLYDQPAFYDQT